MDPRIRKLASFMHIAQAFATRSKDDSSKVGSIILGNHFEVRAAGWNGAPRHCLADTDWRFQERPEKYFWSSHAESNAIANAARAGTSINGCTLLVTMPPCMDCAKLIVQAGICTVIALDGDAEFKARWAGHIERSTRLFHECGLNYIVVGDQQCR